MDNEVQVSSPHHPPDASVESEPSVSFEPELANEFKCPICLDIMRNVSY
jgi:hypothetical protein